MFPIGMVRRPARSTDSPMAQVISLGDIGDKGLAGS